MYVFVGNVYIFAGHRFTSMAFKDYTGEVEEARWREMHELEWQGTTDALVFCQRNPADLNSY